MIKMMKSKGQLSLEAGIVLLFMITVIASVWLGGPIQQSTEKSVDTNGIVLAAKSLDTIASAVEVVGIGGAGERKDFVIHVPFNTVDIGYSDEPNPHIWMSVLVYNNISNSSETALPLYTVDIKGRPFWYRQTGALARPPSNTSFYYKNITRELPFKLYALGFPLCEEPARKTSIELRGPSTQLYFVDTSVPNDYEQKPLSFCCEAGFNLHLYAEKSPDIQNIAEGKVAIRPRHYYSLPPGGWIQLG
jgi:hypothetical protein